MSSKTHKRSTESDAAENSIQKPSALDQMLDAGAADAYKRPWHRLERGLRLNRLRSFVDDEVMRVSLSESESAQLLGLLQKGLDKKMLNSKTTVIYDQDVEKIKEIKGLVSHRSADGILRYTFVEKRAIQTLRRRKIDATA
jgi:hypothetical protein